MNYKTKLKGNPYWHILFNCQRGYNKQILSQFYIILNLSSLQNSYFKGTHKKCFIIMHNSNILYSALKKCYNNLMYFILI